MFCRWYREPRSKTFSIKIINGEFVFAVITTPFGYLRIYKKA